MFVGNIFEVSMSFCVFSSVICLLRKIQGSKVWEETHQQWQLILSLEELRREHILCEGVCRVCSCIAGLLPFSQLYAEES